MSASKVRKNFRNQFEPLPEMNQDQNWQKASQSESAPVLVRVSTLLNEKLLEQMKDYCYWNGLSQQQLIEQAVANLLSKQETKPRPDAVKARPKTGRKPKQ